MKLRDIVVSQRLATMTRREQAGRIEQLSDEGLCTREIGKKLGMSRQRVMRIAAQYGVRLQPRGGTRRIRAQLSGKDATVLKELAAQANVSVGTMLARIARVMVEDGAGPAARRLGRAARPKRTYNRRAA